MSVPTESYAGKIQRKLIKKQRVIEAASGRQKADLVLKNATYVNVFSNELLTCDIAVANGLIVGLGSYEGEVEYDMTGKIVCPGFVDAHIHLESSLVTPKEFVRATLPHGTTTVITDPHEITNVMGTDGIDYMFQATEGLPIDVRFMLPSCVPATPMDESGANLDYRAIDSFYDYPRVQGLAEMMNSYGVIHNDPEVVSKIVASQAHHKKIDGHAPGLQGKDLDTYVAAGVYSDHECATLEDALAKLQRGQFIMIREGTAARNLEALVPLLTPQYAERCMFCTDDKHPNDLLEKGHIDYICREAINKYGADPILTVKVACSGLMEYVEQGILRGPEVEGYLLDKLEPYLKVPIDAVVLGCTHYPFLRGAIRRIVGRRPEIIDGSFGIAKQLHRRLEEQQLLNPGPDAGSVSFQNSLDEPEMLELMQALFSYEDETP